MENQINEVEDGIEELFEDNSISEDINENSLYMTEGADEGDLTIEGSDETVVIEKNDRSLSDMHRWYKAGRLKIDPEWQRSYVWDYKRASKLIESFLMDIPVPVIYLAKTRDSKYEVIDGVQRLTSIFQFMDGGFSLSHLEFLHDLNKLSFSDLTPDTQNKLMDSTLRTFELSPQTSTNLLFIIFERLNSGGVALNEMEIRNCVFRGKLNTLIKKLAEVPAFTAAVNQKNLGRRMTDRSLVLRFLAFYERTYLKAQSGLKSFLNEFFEIHKNPTDQKLAEFEKQFRKVVRASYTIFGSQAFRIRRVDKHGGGEWAAQVNATVFQILAVSFTVYDLGQLTRQSDAIYEEYLDLVSTDNVWIDCVTKSTGDFQKIKYAFQTWNERLAKVMEGDGGNDSKRIFSKQLKQEIFEQNRSCSLCNQEIKSVNDAAMDHDQHYWRGGETIPTNARLVHRLCNLKRPK